MYVNLVILGACLILFLASCLLVRVYAKYALRKGMLDIPNERSAHKTVIPRGAGIIFISLWLVFVLLGYQFAWLKPELNMELNSEFFWLIFPGVFLMMLLGFWEDLKSLSPRRRLFFQGVAALIVVFIFFYYGRGISGFYLFNSENFVNFGPALGALLAVLWLMWSTNLFNFMDGLDGLAAIETLFVLGVTGWLYHIHGDTVLAYYPWSLCFGVLGYLIWNWPKAKVFMGDVGSYSLGFLIAIFALIGSIKFAIPFFIWLIAYGLFWFDATITLFRRLLMRKNVALAHRDHAYQRLHQRGISNKKLLYLVIGVNTVLSAMAIWVSYNQQYMIQIFCLALILLSLLYYKIERLAPMKKN